MSALVIQNVQFGSKSGSPLPKEEGVVVPVVFGRVAGATRVPLEEWQRRGVSNEEIERFVRKYFRLDDHRSLMSMVIWFLSDLPAEAKLSRPLLERFVRDLRDVVRYYQIEDCSEERARKIVKTIKSSNSWEEYFMEALDRVPEPTRRRDHCSRSPLYQVILCLRAELEEEVRAGQWPGLTPESPVLRVMKSVYLMIWHACVDQARAREIYALYNHRDTFLPQR